MSAATDVLRRAVATTPTGFIPLLALRPAVGITAGLAYGVASGHLLAGVSLAAGAIPVGVASLVGRFKAPLLMLLVTCVVTGLSTFAGSLSAHVSTGLDIPLLAAWAFAAGLAVALGPVPAVVATQAVVAYIVFGRFPLAAGQAADQGLLIAAGGLVQIALVGTVRRRGRFQTERRAVGAAYQALAGLALAPDRTGSSLPAGAAVAEARAVLARSWAAPGSTAREAFTELVDEGGRLRLDLVALVTARTRLERMDARAQVAVVDDFAGRAAAALTALATAVATGHDADGEALTVPGDDAGPGPGQPAYAAWWFARSRMAAIAGQLRAASAPTVPRDRHHSRGRPTPPAELRSALRVLRANLDPTSATFRHASRLAMALPVAELVAHALAARRGYWVPLTLLLVLKPDFATTTSRGAARVAGTAVGVGLATLLADGLDPTGWGLVVAVGLLAWGMLATLSWNYGVFSVFNAGLVVFLISAADPQPTMIALDRLVETVLGGALAFLAYLAWPAWSGREVRPTVAALLTAQAAYADVTLAAVATAQERSAVRRAGDRARLARSDAETVLQRAAAEPAPRQGDLATARRLVAASGRMVRAVHEVAVLGGTDRPELPALQAFRRSLLDAAGGLAEAFRTDSAPPAMPDLRAAYDRLAAALDRPGGDSVADADPAEAARRTTLLAACDELVDSVDLTRDVLAERADVSGEVDPDRGDADRGDADRGDADRG